MLSTALRTFFLLGRGACARSGPLVALRVPELPRLALALPCERFPLRGFLLRSAATLPVVGSLSGALRISVTKRFVSRASWKVLGGSGMAKAAPRMLAWSTVAMRSASAGTLWSPRSGHRGIRRVGCSAAAPCTSLSVAGAA